MASEPDARDEHGNRVKGRHRLYALKVPPRGVKRVPVTTVSHTSNATHTSLVSLPLAPWDITEEVFHHG